MVYLKYYILFKIKEEIRKYNKNNSLIIYPDDKSYYCNATNTIRFKTLHNEVMDNFLLAHELSHYFLEDKSNLLSIDDYDSLTLFEKLYLPAEYEANKYAIAYLHFIEEMDIEQIFELQKEIGLFPCRYYKEMIMGLTLEDLSPNPEWIINISLSEMNPYDFSSSISIPFITILNNNNEPMAHVSLRNRFNLWFAFHNGMDWKNFIVPKIFINNYPKEIKISISQHDRDFITVNGKEYPSPYMIQNKDFVNRDFRIEKNIDFLPYIKDVSYGKV